MGLRFRKSITLCKGVKLNLGKTGMSVSVGGKGYHKTINTQGQVTTSMGIPGTGIYYTDTKNLRENKTTSSKNNWAGANNLEQRSSLEQKTDYEINSAVASYLNRSENAEQTIQENDIVYNTVEENFKGESWIYPISHEIIKEFYMTCDEAIDWTELLVSTSAEDVFMETETWQFLKGISRRVLSGDIDAYLETIEKMRPIDDLLEYGSDFEFGTDNAKIMEVEFRINANKMLPDMSSVGKEEYELLF